MKNHNLILLYYKKFELKKQAFSKNFPRKNKSYFLSFVTKSKKHVAS